jgi:hypothetical protein
VKKQQKHKLKTKENKGRKKEKKKIISYLTALDGYLPYKHRMASPAE